MKYLEIEITVRKEYLDELCAKMALEGFDSYEVYDYCDLENAIGEVFYDYIDEKLLEQKNQPPKLKIYFDDSALDEKLRLEGVLSELESEGVSYVENTVDTEDWENNWKKYFYPFPVGERFYVKPTWEELDPEEVGGRTVLEIDPASAFGSGTHATTKLCLEMLEKYLKKGDRVLDMGCGSGILGIGALKLGAGGVAAVDIDPNAVRVAGENFISNSCSEEGFTLSCGDAVTDPGFAKAVQGDNRIILANIVAAVIIALGDFFLEKLCDDGILIASGIIAEREKEVKEALVRAGFEIVESRVFEDWACVVLKKAVK
ncbi:MAG: 50S ribosomal protein L11 methyltransferase [Ruminococcaceae bacterium]|nr:50S ribosomal protein L11 methyltransferase [Oscillospiraceae bacterium]